MLHWMTIFVGPFASSTEGLAHACPNNYLCQPHNYSQSVSLYSESHDDHNNGRDETHNGRDTLKDIQIVWSESKLSTHWKAEAASVYIKVETIGTLKYVGSCILVIRTSCGSLVDRP